MIVEKHGLRDRVRTHKSTIVCFQLPLLECFIRLARFLGQFDFLVFDAFSSDAIPMHLLTREAVGMYADKLGKDGLMAFHISNLHFDLEPILGDIAAALELESLTCHDRELSEEEMIEGKAASSYVVIAKDLQRTGLAGHRLWKTTRRSSRKHPWTDDFSNLFDALKKGE